jgi:putative transposase
LDVLHSERFVDKAPRTVYATLLDEGSFLCSVSTMYRILRASGEVHERRKQRNHRNYTKPELLATQSNQVWSWDITKLRGPAKWHFYYLYVIMDIFSRYVVGWLVAHRECGDLAKELIQASCDNQGIRQDQLIIHSDRGSPMKSKTVAELLSDLKVGKSFGRPSVSNDNPFSEAQFKTLKYHPTFPDRFGSIQDARQLCREFFSWYNNDHYHSSLGFLAPKSVHQDEYRAIIAERAHVLEKAYGQHPERFVKGISKPQLPPQKVWINPPQILVPVK